MSHPIVWLNVETSVTTQGENYQNPFPELVRQYQGYNEKECLPLVCLQKLFVVAKKVGFQYILVQFITFSRRMKGDVYKPARNATYSFKLQALPPSPIKVFIYRCIWLILLSA